MGKLAARHGLDAEAFLKTIHGVQSVETIRRLGRSDIDPVAEAAWITQAELEDVEGIEAIAGAPEFLADLANYPWAVVTSAPRALARHRIAAAGLPVPPLVIAAEDVEEGKPAPDCFHRAAEHLGTTAARCLVFEDSSAGILAAERAGACILVVTATHDVAIDTPHPTIRDYRALSVEAGAGGTIRVRRRGTMDEVDAAASYALRAPRMPISPSSGRSPST